MTDYTKTHAKILKKVGDRGADITFRRQSSSSYDETSESPTPASGTVSGKAVEQIGDPEEYDSLNLTGHEPVTMIFVPTTMGELPPVGSTATWAGVKRTVRERYPIRPAGTIIGGRLILV